MMSPVLMSRFEFGPPQKREIKVVNKNKRQKKIQLRAADMRRSRMLMVRLIFKDYS